MDSFEKSTLEMISLDLYCAWDSLFFYHDKRIREHDSEIYNNVMDNLEDITGELFELHDRIETLLNREES